MKLKKNEIGKLSAFMAWDINTTKKAMKHFREFDFPADHDDFIRICLNCSGEEERNLQVYDFLISHITGSPTEILAKLVRDEYIYEILIFFNTVESSKIEGHLIDLTNTKTQYIDGPQFIFFEDLVDLNGSIIRKYNYHELQELYDNTKLEYLEKLYSLFIKEHFEKNTNDEFGDFQSLQEIFILEFASEAGFYIFDVPSVRKYVNDHTLRGGMKDNFAVYSDPNFLKKLTSTIGDPLINRADITKKRYWLIYCLVEELKKSHGTLESFRVCAKLLSTSKNTIHARYYGMQRELRKNKLSINQVIQENGLRNILKNLIDNIDQ